MHNYLEWMHTTRTQANVAHGHCLFSYNSKRDEHRSVRGIPVYTHRITIYKNCLFSGIRYFSTNVNLANIITNEALQTS